MIEISAKVNNKKPDSLYKDIFSSKIVRINTLDEWIRIGTIRGNKIKGNKKLLILLKLVMR